MTPESKKIRWAKIWTWTFFWLSWALVFCAGMTWTGENPLLAFVGMMLAGLNWSLYRSERRELDDLLERRSVNKWLDKRDSVAAKDYQPGTLRIGEHDLRTFSLWEEPEMLRKAGAPITETSLLNPEYKVLPGWELREEYDVNTFDKIYTWKKSGTPNASKPA